MLCSPLEESPPGESCLCAPEEGSQGPGGEGGGEERGGEGRRGEGRGEWEGRGEREEESGRGGERRGEEGREEESGRGEREESGHTNMTIQVSHVGRQRSLLHVYMCNNKTSLTMWTIKLILNAHQLVWHTNTNQTNDSSKTDWSMPFTCYTSHKPPPMGPMSNISGGETEI